MNKDDLLNQLERHSDPAGSAEYFLPTGSPALDILLGGGWPAGVISELCGPPEYTGPLAYQTVAAVQRAFPDEPVFMCCGDYSSRLASRYDVDAGRLLVTWNQGKAVHDTGGARLGIVDRPLDARIPLRDDLQLTLLYLTMCPGLLVRSAACLRLSSCGARGWAQAERLWDVRHPGLDPFGELPVCLGPDAAVQDILNVALLLGITSKRGRWYYFGDTRLGGSWQEAADWLFASPRIRAAVLSAVAEQAPVYPGWRHAYC